MHKSLQRAPSCKFFELGDSLWEWCSALAEITCPVVRPVCIFDRRWLQPRLLQAIATRDVAAQRSEVATSAQSPRSSLQIGTNEVRLQVPHNASTPVGSVISGAWSPSGERALITTGCDDGFVRVWDTGTGKLIWDKLLAPVTSRGGWTAPSDLRELFTQWRGSWLRPGAAMIPSSVRRASSQSFVPPAVGR